MRCISVAILVCAAAVQSAVAVPVETELLDAMEAELQLSLESFPAEIQTPVYFLQYAVTEHRSYDLSIHDGGFTAPDSDHGRYLDVDLRVGSMELDN
ncbi:MAG: hypothetical protein GF355_06535, partial [Candidatus Eisenbacteria bacterium]|nr:hypothetical protein [Candidatus Eisenbacteria bacterium]